MGRHSAQVREWKRKIRERDNYTCQNNKCGRSWKNGAWEKSKEQGRGWVLQVHHIWLGNFNDIPREIKLETNLGITLCYICHKKLHRRLGDAYGYNYENINE